MKKVMLTAGLLLLWTALLSGAATVEINEWRVPWDGTRPRDPDLDANGRVWFVGQAGNYVAVLDPRNGQFKRYELEAGVGPHNLVVDERGVWYAGNHSSHIGKLDPDTGRITKYSMPDPAARDPHTLVFDRNGDIWFTQQVSNFVGKLDTRSGAVRLIKVPTDWARPYGIVIDALNRPWFNEFGVSKIGVVDPATMQIKEYPLPNGARSRRIAVTSDRAVWYVDYARGFLGRLNPETGQVREWQMPGGARSQPYAMAADDRDRLWLVETGSQPNRLVGFDPKSEQFFSVTEIKSGGGAVRHMVFHKPSRAIWFGTDMNTIGRAVVP